EAPCRGQPLGIVDNEARIGFSLMIRDVALVLTTAALVALLLWAPLPFGSVTYGARAGLELGCVAAFLCSLGCRRHACGRSRRALGLALLVAAAFEILYGTRRWTTDASLIWGVMVPGGPGRLRGTFVNPDHLALLLELSLAVAFAWLWWALRRSREALSLE